MARPRDADRIDIPGRALAEATRIVEARGAEGLTLGEVAAAVGCRAPALYRYYPGKEALLLAVHDEGFRRLYTSKLDVADATRDDAFARLEAGGLMYVRFALANPHLYELMFADRSPFHLLSDQDRDEEDLGVRSLAFLTESVAACQREGYLVGLDARTAAFTFWSAVHGAVSLAIRRRSPFTEVATAEGVEQVVATVMALVAATRASGHGG